MAVERYWAKSAQAVLSALGTGGKGLSSAEAATRLARFGRNVVGATAGTSWPRQLLDRFASPLVLILLVAAGISIAVHEYVDAGIVLGIVLLTAVLGFVQEYRASVAVEALRKRVRTTASVMRDGALKQVPAEEVVPGDIVELSAGALVPADALVLESRSCHVTEAVLTGEPLPVEKSTQASAADAGLAARSNCVFMGTSVRSGWARVVVVDTGASTQFGAIAGDLLKRAPETEFERGLRHFGGMLVKVMLVVVVVVLAINVLMGRPIVDTLLFAAALAVGLSPELLPAILTITLSHGARAMAAEGVVVKRLNAIENLGSMDVLCTDKTGTLTRGVIELDGAVDAQGAASPSVMRLAVANARLQTGIANGLDDAISARGEHDHVDLSGVTKLEEIPYDFQRRCLSVVASGLAPAGATLVCKGAVENVFAACTRVRRGEGEPEFDAAMRAECMQRFAQWSQQGYRVLAVATRPCEPKAGFGRQDEAALTLEGFLLFLDPPEPQVRTTLAALAALNVDVKIITGDNRFVAQHVAEAIGMAVRGSLTGTELQQLSDEALWQRAPATTLFSEIEPNQKERIITALRKSGHVVGYMGDGINDAPALHAADVGISVDNAVDVAKEAADVVLLRHDLDVIRRGIDEGRHTFANTMKYVFITISANFGNMISMAVASLYLPFLPMLAKQILLNNFLSDVPAMGIAGDNVDREWQSTPHRWDIGLIRRSMLVFGLTSTVFDLLTFAVLLKIGSGADMFRSGWFMESLMTELLILLVIRTYRPFWRSRPGRFLGWSVAVMMGAALALPYLPGAHFFGFVPLPGRVLGAILGVTALYLLASEAGKRMFYRRFQSD